MKNECVMHDGASPTSSGKATMIKLFTMFCNVHYPEKGVGISDFAVHAHNTHTLNSITNHLHTDTVNTLH